MTRLPSKGLGHGGPARNYSRPPFEAGHELSMRHGSYVAPWRVKGEIADRAAAVAELVPGMCPAFVPVVDLYAITSIRIERAQAALAELDEATADDPLAPFLSESAPRLDRLREDLRRWVDLAARLLVQLGLTPAAAAALGADVVHIERYREEQLARLQEAGRAAFDARDAEEVGS